MQTRTQRFAGKAMASVAARKGNLANEYKARADSFPTMVLQSGLTQALGFLRSKGGVYVTYVDDVAHVLGRASAAELHREAVGSTLPVYRRLTHEVLEAAGLIKRYAQIVLKDEKDGGRDAD